MHHLWSIKLLLLLVTLLVGTNSKFCCAASLTADEHKPSIIEKYSNTNKTTNYYEETSSDKFISTEEVITNDHYYVNATKIQLHRPKRAVLEGVGFFIPLGSTCMTLFDFVSNKLKSDDIEKNKYKQLESNTKILINGLDEMKDTLAIYEYKLESLASHISCNHMKTQIFQFRISIREGLTYSSAFIETNSDTSKENLIKHGPMLETAINTILNGLSGFDKEFDILDEVRKAENCHARKFLEGVEAYRRLLMVALGLIPIYYKVTNADQKHIAFMKREWIKNDEKALDRIRKIEVECRDERAQNIEKDMQQIMLETNSAETTEQVSKRIYNHLSDKYETSLWAVITYPADSGWNNHAWKGCCRKGTVFQVRGKNAVAFSFQRNEKAANNERDIGPNFYLPLGMHRISDGDDTTWRSFKPNYTHGSGLFEEFFWNRYRVPALEIINAAEKKFTFSPNHHGYGVISEDSRASIKMSHGISYYHMPFSPSFIAYASTITFPGHLNMVQHFSAKNRRSHLFLFREGKSETQRKYFWLESKLNNLALDDSTRASTYPGGFVHMHPYHGRANQFWYFEEKSSTIRAMKTDLCLTSNGGWPNHVTLELCNPDKRNDQKWTLENNGNVASVDESMCLDILHENRGTFARLIVHKCHGKPNQKWTRKYY